MEKRVLYNVATYIFSIKTNAREILCCIRTGRVSHSANLDGHTGIRPHFGNRTGNGSMFKQIIGQLEKGSLKSIETSKRKIRKTQRANRSVIKAGLGNIQQGRPESLPFRDRSFHKVFHYILLKQSAITGQHVKKCTAFFKLTGVSIWF